MSAKDGPTRRVLEVLRIVAERGPITLAALTHQCDFSRAAIWRALDVLRAEGWVRMRLGDNAYLVTYDCPLQHQNRRADYIHGARMSAWMASFSAQYDCDLILAGFDEDDRFWIFESTRKYDYAVGSHSLTDDPIALAAQMTLDRIRLLSVLQAFLKACTLREKSVIEAGQHAQALSLHNAKGSVWTEQGEAVAVPVAHLVAPGFAVAIRSKTRQPLSTNCLKIVNNASL